MIGKRYWSTGIRLRYSGDRNPAWAGDLNFFDGGFGADDASTGHISTVGDLRTRYWLATHGMHQRALRAVTDNLIQDAETLGIEFRDPYLYAAGDGEDLAHPLPEGWVELLEEQAGRLGWGMPGYESHRR
jgi:hypothetical protein